MYYSNRGMARNMLNALEAYNSKTTLLIDSKLEICSTEPGIYGSKPTESEGVARGQGRFTLP